jgi:uncharacterized OB-fold protein
VSLDTYIDTAPFWEGAARRRLVLQICRDTGRFQHLPRPVSVYTGSRNLGWREVSGSGIIRSCTTLKIGQIPKPAVLVDLDAGVRMLSWIERAEPHKITPGLRVDIDWLSLEDGRQWPVFRPA